MKRFLVLICLAFCSCNATKNEKTVDNGKLKVLSTVAQISDVVKDIGGPFIECSSLIEGDLDPHTYEMVKGDDEKFQKADLVFYNGLGLENGHSLAHYLEKNQKAVGVGNWILEQQPSLILQMQGQYDPHIWLDVSLWNRIIDPIEKALCEKDPEHAAVFKENAANLRKKMLEADLAFYEKLQLISQEKRFLITGHDAFHYFTRRYLASQDELVDDKWKIRSQAPEGLSPDSELSIADIAAVLAHIETYKISVIFPESNLNIDSLNKIVDVFRKKGGNLRLSSRPLYADSMGKGNTYLMMMKHNVEVIAEELK